ncbi:MAG TPA: ROK family protein [Actinobacteria bacterium]|nr:ROK family protein [Actinomycetota bacterium]
MEALLGIDIGGSGIKGAPVDSDQGEMLTKRWRIETPQPATPEAVAAAVGSVVRHFDDVSGPIGITFPAVVKNGVTLSAGNVDDAWIGTDAAALFADQCGRPVSVVNDADAAGIAEMAFGAGVGRDGVVIVLTFGTGVGSGTFSGGSLVPNTEFGLLELHGSTVEQYCAGRIKDEVGLTFGEWGDRVNELLVHLQRLFLPDLLVIGGGISKYFHEFSGRFDLSTDVLPATMRNDAGIIGAAMVAAGAGMSNLRPI